MGELYKYISEARKYITLKKYYEAASIYEKLGKTLFKTDVKTSLNLFKLAIKYYLKSIVEYDKARKLEETARCYESLGKIYKKWLNDTGRAADYFIAATKYRMKALKTSIDYNNGENTNTV